MSMPSRENVPALPGHAGAHTAGAIVRASGPSAPDSPPAPCPIRFP